MPGGSAPVFQRLGGSVSRTRVRRPRKRDFATHFNSSWGWLWVSCFPHEASVSPSWKYGSDTQGSCSELQGHQEPSPNHMTGRWTDGPGQDFDSAAVPSSLPSVRPVRRHQHIRSGRSTRWRSLLLLTRQREGSDLDRNHSSRNDWVP